MPEIKLRNKLVSYHVRYSKRARYVRFKIDLLKGLEVVLPYTIKLSDFEVELLLVQRQDWILENLQKADQARPTKRTYETGETMPYLGRDLTLDVIYTQNEKYSTVQLEDDCLKVWLHGRASLMDHTEVMREVLQGWYRHQAKAYIPKRVAELAKQTGLTDYKRITIRQQKTLWGSCSSKKNLNFNLRLMLAPAEALDYVIIHELCHLKEMNHSKRFWRLVEKHCPDYRKWEKWLDDHGDALYV